MANRMEQRLKLAKSKEFDPALDRLHSSGHISTQLRLDLTAVFEQASSLANGERRNEHKAMAILNAASRLVQQLQLVEASMDTSTRANMERKVSERLANDDIHVLPEHLWFATLPSLRDALSTKSGFRRMKQLVAHFNVESSERATDAVVESS